MITYEDIEEIQQKIRDLLYDYCTCLDYYDRNGFIDDIYWILNEYIDE